MPARPRLKLAIVGGGPSAFFAASRLLQLIPQAKAPTSTTPELAVHIYDRLWAPHGLVRYGVAPDHPEVKNCTNKFDEAALDTRLRFFGNVNISPSKSPIAHALNVPLASVFPHYSHLLLASGCTVPRLHPSLPPSLSSTTPSLRVYPALDLVHWYTSHPSRHVRDSPPLEDAEHVTVVGNGNVALDVARMLLAPLEYLKKYDVPESVLQVLAKSKVRHVSIVGRRGPREAAFTTKELRELMSLPNAAMVPLDEVMIREAMDESKENGGPLTRQQKRMLELMQKGSKNVLSDTKKSWSLDFFRSPTGVVHADDGQRMDLMLAHTALEPPSMSSTYRRAIPTGETSTMRTDLVYTSLGYSSSPTDAWFDPTLSHIRNTGGRVIDEKGKIVKGVYASGWAANGARGVLATTMLDAHTVVDTIISDLRAQTDAVPQIQTTAVPPSLPQPTSWDSETSLNSKADLESVPSPVMDGILCGNVMDYASWKKIDAEEIRRGQIEGNGKERERMTWEEARTFISECH